MSVKRRDKKREKIKMLKKDLDDRIVSNGGDMTVLQLVQKYVGPKNRCKT